MNAAVYALSVYNGSLIAGGLFTTAGGAGANYVAAWDGVSWSPLGSGMNGIVTALAEYNGRLVAGGVFTIAGGVWSSSIAAWDSSSWQPLGTGMNGGVYALTLYDDQLIAGGDFTAAGGVSANLIAAWDSSAWQTLGSGTAGAIYPCVLTMTTCNGQLIAGGEFTIAGGDVSAYWARWEGCLSRKITSLRSVRTHALAGAMPILLSTVDVNTETRGGIRRIEADLDIPVASVNPARVDVTAGPASYVPESVMLSQDKQMVILTFAELPGDHYLPDGQCYTITLASDMVVPALDSPVTVSIRSLAGDTTGNGTINLGDVLYIQRFTGEEVNAGTALFDVNLDEMITTMDMLVVKDGVTSPPLQVACP